MASQTRRTPTADTNLLDLILVKKVSTNSRQFIFATTVAIRATDAMTMTAVAQAAIAAATATISADRIHTETVDGINFALPNGVNI